LHAKGRRRGELWGSLGADLGVWLAVLECIRRGLLDHLMRDAIRMHSDVQSEAIRDAIHAIRGHQRCNPCNQRPSEMQSMRSEAIRSEVRSRLLEDNIEHVLVDEHTLRAAQDELGVEMMEDFGELVLQIAFPQHRRIRIRLELHEDLMMGAIKEALKMGVIREVLMMGAIKKALKMGVIREVLMMGVIKEALMTGAIRKALMTGAIRKAG
jgi:hypothetical protein